MEKMQKFLGSQLRVFRDMRGLSQIELAERLSVSKETVGKIERGQAAPSFRTLDKLCRELGISPRSLFPAAKYERHKPASTALDTLMVKASDLKDEEILWLIELLETIEKRP